MRPWRGSPDAGASSASGQEGRWLESLPEQARERLPRRVHDYVVQGSREGLSAQEATAAWRRHRLLPHVLRDVTHVDTSVDLLGHRLDVAWGVAPSTLQRAVHPDGELAVARACAEAGSLLVVSSNVGTTFAEIGATGVQWWLQAYLPSDRTTAVPLLRRAVDAGASAIVLSVDTPVVATKYLADRAEVESDLPGLTGVNHDPADLGEVDVTADEPGDAARLEKALDLGPHDLAWLADVTGLPVVVKGVLRPDDAVRCVQAGAAAVWVSNHGGRQLDRVLSTADALPGVAAAVGDDVPVYVDGGVRTGLDVVTALGLGADAAFLGRLPLYALLDGQDGVARMHRELGEQTREAMRLCGCSTVADLRGVVVTGQS